MTKIIITKKIAKHGNQAVLIIPKDVEDLLKPQTLVQATLEIIGDDHV
ncbi:hypothetical protein J4410_04900 [Candidatus Woesearchaeota archaeon]|nr:hypothetical protein [Candidatus Woesearchaeota archaeon]